MVEFKLSNGDLLSRAVSPLGHITGDDIIKYSPDGITLIALDLTECISGVLRINSSCFDFFHCNHSGIAGMDLDKLCDKLELEQDEDSITIRAGEGEDRFHFLFGKAGSDRFRSLEMKLVEVRNEDVDAANNLQYEYEVVLGIPSGEFISILTDLGSVPDADTVLITITDGQVEFSSENRKFVLRKESGDCIIGSVAEEVDGVQINIDLLNMSSFHDASALSGTVWILHSRDAPAMLNFPVAAIGNIMFYLMGCLDESSAA